MDRFATPRVFQAKPSNLKKKLALAAFAAGAIAFTLAVTGVISTANGGPFFAGGLVAMAFAFRFWLMQVRSGPMAVTFDANPASRARIRRATSSGNRSSSFRTDFGRMTW